MKTKIYRDPVVEAYMSGVDRTLLRENLKLTYEQRARKHQNALQIIEKLRQTGKHSDFLATAKTTDDVFKYATKQGLSEDKALKKGIEAKSKEFVEKGAEVYTKV